MVTIRRAPNISPAFNVFGCKFLWREFADIREIISKFAFEFILGGCPGALWPLDGDAI